MNLLHVEPYFWYLVVAFVVTQLLAVSLIYLIRSLKRKGGLRGLNKRKKSYKPSGREVIIREIARLQAGGDLNESLIKRLSTEERVLFEISVIDILTEAPCEDQHALRSTLVKHGYDDQCARRLMRAEMPDRVRASTLLNLLRPQLKAEGK